MASVLERYELVSIFIWFAMVLQLDLSKLLRMPRYYICPVMFWTSSLIIVHSFRVLVINRKTKILW